MPEKGRNGVNEYASELLEKILNRDNINLSYKRLKANKGRHRVDGMTVNQHLQYMKQNFNQIRQSKMEWK
jgi:retron-type reverse transcriptase